LNSGSVLETHNLSVHFGARSALDDVSIDIAHGTITSVLGPNGAGKSTLLKALGAIVPPSHGSVSFRGDPLHRAQPAITYVPQRSGAVWSFPISVIETVLLGAAHRAPRYRAFNQTERKLALNALNDVGLLPLADVQIGALSGGQQQRVFLARALVACGDVLLLDEPFAGVDIATQELFLDVFEDLRSRGVTIVVATHDLHYATRSSSRSTTV
jgi:manganese/zinc/iron transport system ATP- binding protein